MTGYVDALVQVPRSTRDRLLVMFACVLYDMTLTEISRLTPEAARRALDQVAGRPHVDRAREMLELYAETLRGDLLFESRQVWPYDEPQPISRTTAWRIVRNAVTAVFGVKVEGAWVVARLAGVYEPT